MTVDQALFELVRHPLQVRLLEVVRTESLSPRMRRITLGGPELAGFVSLAPEDHVKVFFPRSRIRASGHWKRGVVGHDHHEPILG
ncbi:MAG TPA: siderophore-interacting protein [Polyangiaceae bacterium]|nr:siderophore-interacting protein [Polyangiaceae bacterium]